MDIAKELKAMMLKRPESSPEENPEDPRKDGWDVVLTLAAMALVEATKRYSTSLDPSVHDNKVAELGGELEHLLRERGEID